MPDVELGWGVTDVGCEREPVRGGIRKRITSDGCGTVVHRLAVRVRAAELEAAAHPFLHVKLETLVSRTTSKSHVPDTTEVRIDPQIPGLSSRVGRIVRP